MNDAMIKWESTDGCEFLRAIGLKEGDAVLDFGCRVGHYTIPAARVVQEQGVVYALDMKQDVLDEIKAKADEHKLDNIKLMKTDGQLQIDIENDSVDMAIFYDVLHMYKKDQRRKIYDEVTRMLKPDGIFSVYPKHCKCDHPEREFRLIDAHEIRQEIESCDFICDSQYTGRLSHADDINNGCVFNFIRK